MNNGKNRLQNWEYAANIRFFYIDHRIPRFIPFGEITTTKPSFGEVGYYFGLQLVTPSSTREVWGGRRASRVPNALPICNAAGLDTGIRKACEVS
jgi:hypothetical protein